MPAERPSFTCAICQRERSDFGWYGVRDQHVPPICNGCEVPVSSFESYGGVRRRNRVTHGAFMDRRKVNQIGALAQELADVANQQIWRARYGQA